MAESSWGECLTAVRVNLPDFQQSLLRRVAQPTTTQLADVFDFADLRVLAHAALLLQVYLASLVYFGDQVPAGMFANALSAEQMVRGLVVALVDAKGLVE